MLFNFHDFSGKTILPFCTSHSSGIGTSDTNLHSLAESANWLDGKRFAGGTAREEIAEVQVHTLSLKNRLLIITRKKVRRKRRGTRQSADAFVYGNLRIIEV